MTKLIEVWGNRVTNTSILPIPKQLDVRITSSEIGKSLSIADNDMGVMLHIPLEPIAKELKEALDE